MNASMTDFCIGTGDDCGGGGSVGGMAYQICNADECSGQFATYRFSFTLMYVPRHAPAARAPLRVCAPRTERARRARLFFASMLLCTCTKTKGSSYAHYGFWCAPQLRAPRPAPRPDRRAVPRYLKVVVIAVFFVSAIFASNDTLAVYAWIARFISPLFLFYQMASYIDFGYTLNEAWVEKDERREPFLWVIDNASGVKWKVLLVVSSLVMLIGSVVGIGLMYHYYPMDCAFNPLALSTTLVWVLLNTLLSVSKVAEHGSLFTSALVAAYCTFLCWSAMTRAPDTACNPDAETNDKAVIIFGLIVAAFSIACSAGFAGMREAENSKAATLGMNSAIPKSGTANDAVTITVPSAGSDDDGVQPQRFWNYHVVMFLVSVYFSMLITNWGQTAARDDDDDAPSRVSVGWASAWVTLGSNWLCCLVYCWTLVAPWLCPGRDFS